MTFDNGPEFVNHEVMDCLEYELRIKAYYCHPYSPEERGTNEHCNRMLRQYIPKDTSFERLIDRDVQAVAREINERPRKFYMVKRHKKSLSNNLSELLTIKLVKINLNKNLRIALSVILFCHI